MFFGVTLQDRGFLTADNFANIARQTAMVSIMAFGMTFVLLKVLGALMPLRAPERDEALGMDVTYHGEEAYASGEGAILVTPEAGIEEPVPVADAR